MSKYKEQVVYSGNLMKNTNGQSLLHRENVYLAYEEKTDTFSLLNDTLNCYIDLLRDDLSEDAKEKCRETIKKHSYPYINSGLENQIYVDEESVKIVVDSSNKRR